MAYYLRTYVASGGVTLVEMTQKQTEAASINLVGYDRVSGAYAHRWVRNGGHHETPLYVDYDGRVRYAKDC